MWRNESDYTFFLFITPLQTLHVRAGYLENIHYADIFSTVAFTY